MNSGKGPRLGGCIAVTDNEQRLHRLKPEIVAQETERTCDLIGHRGCQRACRRRLKRNRRDMTRDGRLQPDDELSRNMFATARPIAGDPHCLR
ncbi:hypothetical protein JQ543_00195 [Bradyrhizobium diazoefficiens]|nr:hypothetical protein [Bradyrhizobium diazoefficiens]MBR0846143.1 hypothetical protein [Bradyrhizobium diazoefficiens]